MSETALYKPPLACTEQERREFEQLVRLGFNGSDAGLRERIRKATGLAFYYAEDGELAAIAGLKTPERQYGADVFQSAKAGVSSASYGLELGWVFVLPDQRRRGIGEELCRRLLNEVPTTPVFATTRPNNNAMIRILIALGFRRVGKPYSRRKEELALFLRP
ncbi:MAG TPA: GNAT family N-acetyltransferase [Acidobacteriota bacterium]|nr:GNAT family N-acetyltransferase [Acidobacteriota bacterium]